jgi:hypothetical protein
LAASTVSTPTRSGSGETGYAGLESSDLVRFKQLEDASRRKDRIISKLTLEVDAMKELVEKSGGALATSSRGESLAGSRY